MLPLLFLLDRMFPRRRIVSRSSRRVKVYKKEPGTEFCRTCTSTKNLELIFSGGECEKRSEELLLVTGLEIKLNDGLSQKICRHCKRTIKTALRFRHVSKKTEKILISMTVKTENVPRPSTSILNTSVVKTEPHSDHLEANGFGDMGFIDRYQNYNFPDLYDICKTEPAQKHPHESSDMGSFKCKTCGEVFASRKTFIDHRKVHKKFWVCEECGKSCRSNFELKNHKRAKHGMERIHKCSYCDYSPATQEALTIHERRHTGERPYICDHCGASFYRRSTLVQHIAIHLPDNKYQCDLCPKRLKSKNFLQIHKHDAHPGKRYGYLCSVCDRRFQKPYKVRAHTRRVHGIPDEQQGSIVRVTL